jgi:hypothetical protein
MCGCADRRAALGAALASLSRGDPAAAAHAGVVVARSLAVDAARASATLMALTAARLRLGGR